MICVRVGQSGIMPDQQMTTPGGKRVELFTDSTLTARIGYLGLASIFQVKTVSIQGAPGGQKHSLPCSRWVGHRGVIIK